MRIGIIAPPWLPVPPAAYGGTELVIDQLARGLTARGHDVSLFTVAESTCPVLRGHAFAAGLGTDCTDDHQLLREHVTAAYRWFAEVQPVDLIHDHTTLGPVLQSAEVPVVATLHGVLDQTTTHWVEQYPPNVSVVTISVDQRNTADQLRNASVIHHGLDIASIEVGDGTGDWLVFLGRMSPDKGVAQAIGIARTAELPLKIVAKVQRPEEQRYLAEVVRPLLGDGVEFLGEIGGRDKLRLLGQSRALLNPIRWPEPFGLVMIEALATGTPVIASTEGAAPEIISHGVTGFLCRHRPEAVAACHAVTRLDRGTCRGEALRRFDVSVMVSRYEQLFQRLTHRRAIDLRDDRRSRVGGLFARRETCPVCDEPLVILAESAPGDLFCPECRTTWRRTLGTWIPAEPVAAGPIPGVSAAHLPPGRAFRTTPGPAETASSPDNGPDPTANRSSDRAEP